VAAALACASPAWGYVRTVTSAGAPMFWNRTVITLHAYLGDPPEPLNTVDLLFAAQSAAAVWGRDRIGCTSLELRIAGTQERSAPVELDHVSRLTFRRESWCKEPRGAADSCYDPLALAVTSVFARKSDGEIVDADIEINAVTFKWADLARNPEGASSLQDIQNTLTHELGHFIGLDHTCYIANPRPGAADDKGRPVPSCGEASEEIRATTMFAAVIPGDLERRTLSPDEVKAVCEVYPPVDLVLEAGRPQGCALAGGGGPGAAGLVLLALLLRTFRRAARPARGLRSSRDRSPRR
jgi:hypothetical protein